MTMETFVFATKSNGAISAEDFKPLEKPITVKPDLTYKDGSYTIASKFIEGQTENSGWTVGASNTGRIVLVKFNDDTRGLSRFLKKASPSAKFTSKAIDFQVAQAKLDTSNGFVLVQSEPIAGLENAEVYTLVPSREHQDNVEASELSAPVVEQEQSAPVDTPTETLVTEEIPTIPVVSDVTVPSVEEVA
jgi:hypothetical protein